MGLGNQASDQRFPFSAKVTFERLLSVLAENGLTIRESDALIRRVTASTGMSLLSFGENISIAVTEDGPAACIVAIDSGVKLGANWSGSNRNQKNIDTIIMALSRALQSDPLR